MQNYVFWAKKFLAFKHYIPNKKYLNIATEATHYINAKNEDKTNQPRRCVRKINRLQYYHKHKKYGRPKKRLCFDPV